MLDKNLLFGKSILLKSTNDKRLYEHIVLPNGVRLLVVQDQNCQKTAVSATLHAGHFDDDDDCHGLSHLLEHMLFLGNQLAAKENAFSDFLATCGGSINASTGTEYTSYFFDVQSDMTNDALAHFSAMLINPLLLESSIKKEIQSIDAEFKMKQKDDLRRLYQVHKETCNPAHPFSKFSVGNKQTFGKFSVSQLKAKLHAFHQHFYQPDNVALCIISNESLSKSKAAITQHFSYWPKTHQLIRSPLPSLYLPEQLGVLIAIVPIQNAQRLILTFALPGQSQHYRSKPLSVISHILGDEGEGGLLDYLKSQNWATSLSAGGGIEGTNFKDFNINLQLTDNGTRTLDSIIGAIFSYIKSLQTDGVQAWRINEVAKLNTLMWDYGEPAKPIDEALKLSHALFDYPAEHCVAGDYLLDQPCEEIVQHMLQYFTPKNMRLKFIHQEQKTTKVARWYDTPYQVNILSPEQLRQFANKEKIEAISLPKANPYLNQNQTLHSPQDDFLLPQKIVEQAGLELWFGQDNKFAQPKGDCFLTFDCLASGNGLEMSTYKRLWVALLNEKLMQQYYQANLAGMHFHLYPHQGGFSLQTNGFSAKQLDFFTHLLTQVVSSNTFFSSFEQVKAKQHQSLCNSLLNKPINRLFTRLSVLLQQHNHAPYAMAEIMAKASPQDISETKQQLLDSFYLEGMMYGNWALEDAENVSNKLQKFRGAHKVNPPLKKGLADLRSLPTQVHRVECQHNDDAVVKYFQVPSSTIKDTALTILLEQLISTPFFNQMRTEKQLGYLVGSGYLPYNQHPGIAFYIQSPHQTAEALNNAIETFLVEFSAHIADFEEIWPSLKAGVKRQLSENDSHLSMKSQRLWMAIGNKDFAFQYQHNMAKTIDKLQFNDLVSFYQNMINHVNFGELILISSNEKNIKITQANELVSSIAEFKNHSTYLY